MKFGVGTLDKLEGELIVLNGSFYQIPSDGVARRVDPESTTPFAAVTFFKADDQRGGGHVLSCAVLTATVEIDFTHRVIVEFGRKV